MAIRTLRIPLIVLLSVFIARQSFGFSLLGPFAPWMTPDVGFIHDEAWDVGGPRNLGDEFRWNVPVLTYGFDDNFKNFFGQPGIDAIEKAVAILNQLPAASQIDLTLFSPQTKRIHPPAQGAGLLDLKSAALVYLIEDLGLANAVRFTWVLNSTNIALQTEDNRPTDIVIQRNFDPVNFEPSAYVNSIRLNYIVGEGPRELLPGGNREAYEYTFNFEPYSASVSSHIAYFGSQGLREGDYFATLTRDDVGGIKFLLSSSNINVEPCLPAVRAVGGGNDFVNLASRPGVEKIKLDRFDPGQPPITNVFADTYFIDGQQRTQTLQRVIVAPDILFTAANHPRQFAIPAVVRRTGPNFSHQNQIGAGILQPETVISFQKLGDIYREPYWSDYDLAEPRWSSFDSRTVALTPIFPVGPAYQGGRTLSTRQIQNQNGPAVEWKLRLIAGVQYAIETSPDLTNWTSVTNITAAPIHTLTNSLPNQSQAFWRARRISQ